MKESKRGFAKFVWLVGIAAVLILSIPISIHGLFNLKSEKAGFPFDAGKVWSHRGYVKDHTENTIPAFLAAIDLGAKGIELDVFYDVKLNDFVVSHDKPYFLENGNPIFLSEIFESLPSTISYWIDFKNLDVLENSEIQKAVERYQEFDRQFFIKQRAFIESKSMRALYHFKNEGFYTSLWVENFKMSIVKKALYILKVKLGYLLGYFDFMSMSYNHFDKNMQSRFNGLHFLLFTVNNTEELNRFQKNKNVKIILTDTGSF